MDMYKKFCNDCIQGKIGYKCDFHILDPKIFNNGNKHNSNAKSVDVSIVSPTQAAVDQAKCELKQEMHINEAPMLKQGQTGGSSYRRQIKSVKTKKKTVKKQIRDTKSKINKIRKHSKNKIKKPKKNNTKKNYRLSWM